MTTSNQSLLICRLRTGTVFRLLATGFFGSLVPFSVAMGVLAAFGLHTITWNKAPVTGLSGLMLSPVIGILGALLFTAFFGTAVAFGLWIMSKLRPSIRIDVVGLKSDATPP